MPKYQYENHGYDEKELDYWKEFIQNHAHRIMILDRGQRKENFTKFYQKSLEEWAYRILIDDVWDPVLTKLREEKLDYDFGNIDKVETIINGITAYDSFGKFDGLYMDQLAYCRYYHRIMDFDVVFLTSCFDAGVIALRVTRLICILS